MGRAPCCQKVGLKKGPWTPEEDQLLIAYINQHGHGSWRALPQNAGLLRCGKSCRLRWTNYLRPDIKRGKFSASEEQSIIQLHALLGNRWSAIATHLPKRTDNEIKNYWNTHLKKRLVKMGIDPATHKRKMDTASNLLEANGSSNSALSHMTQWESARLEAEARLARESKMRAKGLWPQVVPHDESSSARRPWHSQARQGFSSVEALRNWEKSLQGQAGFLWPDSWNSTNSVPDGQATSCCSSPHADRMDHGSPTSTSCSLKLRKNGIADSSSFFAIQKLRWTDNSTTAAMKEFSSESVAGLENDKFLPPCSFQMDEILHNSCEEVAITCKADGESLPSLQCTQKNLAVSMVGNTTTTSGSLASPRWSQSSEEDFSMDVCRKETESIPMLDSATTSNSLLCELDLVCEDISSNKSCLASINCTDMPSEFLVDLLNVHCETSSGSGIQDNYNDLLTEDNPDCWNNMLMQLADSTTQPAAASFQAQHI